MKRRLNMVIHAHSGMGKTPLANTAPGPRLLVDTEGGYQYLRNRLEMWNDVGVAPPTGVDEDTTVVVRANDYETVRKVYQWLASGKHPFKSVIVDSITELQEKIKASISQGAFEQQDWGALLDRMSRVVMDFKDLTDHPTSPLDCVIFTAGSLISDKTGLKSPLVQGQLAYKLPYKVAVVGYLTRNDEGVPGLRIQPTSAIDAKDRTVFLSEHYGDVIPGNPETKKIDLREVMRVLNEESEENIAS